MQNIIERREREAISRVVSGRPARWRYVRIQGLIRVICDLTVFVLMYLWAELCLAKGEWSSIGLSGVLGFVVIATGIFYAFGGYGACVIRRPEREFEAVFKAGLACVGICFAVAQYRHQFTLMGGILLLPVTAVGLAGLLALRGVVRTSSAKALTDETLSETAVFVGSDDQLYSVTRRLSLQRCRGLRILERIDAETEEEIGYCQEILQSLQPDLVIVSIEDLFSQPQLLSKIADICRDERLEFQLYSSQFPGDAEYTLDTCTGGLRVARSSARWSDAERLIKSLLDRVVGLLGSLVTLLLVPLIWFLVKLEDGGPVFYRQQYVGPDQNVRYYLKFRTMVQNADKVLQNDPELQKRFALKHKLEDDPRILPFGRVLRRFSIDEFPEFFSVLSGRLSFVGPRTISAAEKARYGSSLPKLLSVKSGLTGFWQASGRQTTSYDERVEMDMFYIDNWSIWLDLVIVAKTFLKFFAQEGAY